MKDTSIGCFSQDMPGRSKEVHELVERRHSWVETIQVRIRRGILALGRHDITYLTAFIDIPGKICVFDRELTMCFNMGEQENA